MKMIITPRKWMSALKLSIALLLLLAACGPSSEALPTAMDLNLISTDDASTRVAQTEVAIASTVTSAALSSLNAPTSLPPTWTPSPIPVEPTQSFLPTQPLQPVVLAPGKIYYGFNGDSIAMLAADGSTDELILVGGKPADIVLSPDEQWLAYTADDGAGVREVFVMSLQTEGVPDDQWYRTLRVSCLGFARVLLPAWSADTRILSFAASQTVDGALGIYSVELAGSNQCPMANHQRGLVQTTFTSISGLTWNPDNTQIYFTSGALYAVDSGNGTLFPPLTQPTGYGPDTSPVYRPNSTSLYYLKTQRDDQSGLAGGGLTWVDTTDFATFPLSERRETLLFAQQMGFNRDGSFLVASGTQDVSVQSMESDIAVVVVTGSRFPPQAVISPAADYVAYIDAGVGPNLMQQIWVVDRRGNNPRQLTTHEEGTIAYLNWASS